jgi:hypothetical protein
MWRGAVNVLSRDGVTIDGFPIGFIDNLHVVTIALSLIPTLYNSLQHTLSLFSLLCFHHSFPGNGF